MKLFKHGGQHPAPVPDPSGLTIAPNGDMSVQWNTTAEARAIIKELRLKKKELQLQKREPTGRQQQLRASYTDFARQHDGHHVLMKSMNKADSQMRSQHRKKLATDLAPLEKSKAEIDSRINHIDHLILQIEAKISPPAV